MDQHCFKLPIPTIPDIESDSEESVEQPSIPISKPNQVVEKPKFNIDNWNIYLHLFFLAIEFLFVRVFGLDMKGYASHQIKSISSYKEILIELCEKYFVESDRKWPVEVRLLIVMLLNTVIFFAVKFLSNMLGGDGISSLIQNQLTNVLSSPKNNTPVKKRIVFDG